MQPVTDHTSKSLCKFVKGVVSELLPHHKQALFFNTTDGAANMKLLSRLLGHERVDCTAHCFHLLLFVDSLNKIPELHALLEKCKQVINAFHFKGHMITAAANLAKDVEMFERIQTVMDILASDDDNPVVGDHDDEHHCYHNLRG